jgi:hypothetical protein
MKIKAYLCLENGKVNPFHEKTATGLTLCMNSNNTSQPVLRIRLKVVNLFYKATDGNGQATGLVLYSTG